MGYSKQVALELFDSDQYAKYMDYLKEYADQGVSDAQWMLGEAYRKGQAVKTDMEKAIYYYTLAAEKGNINALSRLKYCYENADGAEKDTEETVQYYTPAAEKENADAQVPIEENNKKREDTERNKETAVQEHTPAGGQQVPDEQLDVDTLLDLGKRYKDGDGVEKDMKKALYYYTMVAKKGDVTALSWIGYFCENGDGMEKDIERAVYYYNMAAGNGNTFAQYRLGYCYENGKGAEKDTEKAVYYYTMAAEQGHVKSRYRLGYIYENGKGVEKDMKKAAHYYALASEKGNVNAQFHLGKCYANGNGVEKDMEKAAHFFSLAAEKENVDAQSWLGYCYANGGGVKKDMKKAAHYYTLAADKGNVHSQCKLGKLYTIGKGVEKDMEKAVRYHTMAAEKENVDAMSWLGLIYDKGFGVDQDLKKAAHYYNMAAKKGDKASQSMINIFFTAANALGLNQRNSSDIEDVVNALTGSERIRMMDALEKRFSVHNEQITNRIYWLYEEIDMPGNEPRVASMTSEPEDIPNGTLKCRKSHQSSFMIETPSSTLIFDWYKGELPYIRKDKPLHIFISHTHPDHYHQFMLNIARYYPDVSVYMGYDYSSDSFNNYLDSLPERVADTISCFNGESMLNTDFGSILSLTSTDKGVAFLIDVDGMILFHAGDLFPRSINDPNFLKYTEPLRGIPIDYAMLPLDPKNPDCAKFCIDHYMELADIQYFTPMHMWHKPSFATTFARKNPGYCDRMIAENPGGADIYKSIELLKPYTISFE